MSRTLLILLFCAVILLSFGTTDVAAFGAGPCAERVPVWEMLMREHPECRQYPELCVSRRQGALRVEEGWKRS